MLQQSLINDPEQIFLMLAQETKARFHQEGLSTQVIETVRENIWNYHALSRRSFPWRDNIYPYHVVVSEVMLQQTQTYRVEPKFNLFVERFTSFRELANAPFDEVLRYWKGLGYNRRAQNLQKIACAIEENYAGLVPQEPALLQKLPGLGAATAASICTFTHNVPTVFLETNIRTVLIYLFFEATAPVSDQELFPLAAALLDQKNPREWYYALMDIGVMLKRRVGNLTRLSKTYTKQSKFKGSRRQIRGKILELLLATRALSLLQIIDTINDEEGRTASVVDELIYEHFIEQEDGLLRLKQ